jgi:hypothetical protein
MRARPRVGAAVGPRSSLRKIVTMEIVLPFRVAAVNLALSPAELHELGIAASRIPVQGARYPEELQRLVGR